MTAFVTAGAGFLLAVLWFDLMFDVQAARDREPPEAVLASIAGYYARVTTDARPMNRLIALVMLATLAAIVVQIVRGDEPRWAAWASLVLAAVPVVLATTRTLPSAVRLGTRRDGAEVQGRLARTILTEHLVCAAAIATLLVVQLAAAP
ncbi:MAG TPA: hypothetical protein VGO71_01755 [Baekduia sp.]|nr:hypothetical protein [Baekduia sp.]